MQRISDYVNSMFAALPANGELTRIKEQIITHMEDEYDALLAQGRGGEDALRAVIAQFGSIEELKREFDLGQPGELEPQASQPEEDARLQGLERVYRYQLPRAYGAVAAGAACLWLALAVAILWDSLMAFFALAALGAGIVIQCAWDYWQARRQLDGYRAERGLAPRGGRGEPGRGKRRLMLYGAYLLEAVLAMLLLRAWGEWSRAAWAMLLGVPAAIAATELCWKEE